MERNKVRATTDIYYLLLSLSLDLNGANTTATQRTVLIWSLSMQDTFKGVDNSRRERPRTARERHCSTEISCRLIEVTLFIRVYM